MQFAGQAARNDTTKAIADSNSDGLIVTDSESRIIYANEAYMALSGAHGAADLRVVERLFSGAPEVSEAIYRLAQAAREGKRGVEELRMSPPLTGDAAVGWYRIRVRPLDSPGRRRARRCGPSPTSRASASATRTSSRSCSTPSTISTTRRPGFFSVEPDGAISY